MQISIAEAVFAVLDRGLALRDQLDAGAPLDWDREHAALSSLLAAFALQSDHASAEENGLDFVFSERGSRAERRALTHTTIRFALACWLDERLEPSERFGAEDGGAPFWEEARYAEARGDVDALEAMHLCVMLGFRGSWRGQSEALEAWTTRISAKLDRAAQTWTMPASLAPPRFDAGVADDGPLRRMTFSVLLTFALLTPLVLVLWWRL